MSHYRAVSSDEKFDPRFEREMGSAICPKCSARFLLLHFQAFVEGALAADQIALVEKVLAEDHECVPFTGHRPSYDLD